MKKVINGFATIILMTFFVSLCWVSCNDPQPTTATPPYFGLTMEATAKPVRDTVKGAIFDRYKKTVTISYDSLVPVGIVSVVTTPPPVDTVVVPPVDPSVSGYKLIYSNDFNRSSDIDPFGHGQKGLSYINTSFPIEGVSDFRSRPANVSNGCRGEVQFNKEQTPMEGAVEYLVKYNYVVAGYCHSLQWHPSTSGGSASPGLWHENGKWVWKNWKGGTNAYHGTGVTIPKGSIVKMRIEYKFGSNGYFRHYVNGKLIVSWSGQVGDGSAPYFKMGFNGNFNNNLTEAVKSDIEYDQLRVYQKV